MTNNTIRGNTATAPGGAMVGIEADGVVRENVIVDNARYANVVAETQSAVRVLGSSGPPPDVLTFVNNSLHNPNLPFELVVSATSTSGYVRDPRKERQNFVGWVFCLDPVSPSTRPPHRVHRTFRRLTKSI